MLFLWGTKRTEKKQGLVADFCPLCRGVRAFRLSRIGTVSHLYFLSFGQGKLVGHVIQCQECGVRLSTDALKYASFAAETKGEAINQGELEQSTFPQVREVYAERLALETQLRRTAGVLGPEQRSQLLLEPFRLLNPAVETRYAENSTFDKHSGLGCAGTAALSFAFFVIALSLGEPWLSRLTTVAVGVFVIGVLYTFVQMALGPGRFLREKTIPALARALDPLEPTQVELQSHLDKCKTAGMKIGEKVKLARLWAELERRTASLVVG